MSAADGGIAPLPPECSAGSETALNSRLGCITTPAPTSAAGQRGVTTRGSAVTDVSVPSSTVGRKSCREMSTLRYPTSVQSRCASLATTRLSPSARLSVDSVRSGRTPRSSRLLPDDRSDDVVNEDDRLCSRCDDAAAAT